MPEQARPPVFGTDLMPVRARDVHALRFRDNSESTGRNVKGEPLELPDLDELENLVTLATLWEQAESFQRREHRKHRRGRPREHSVFEAFFAMHAKAYYPSERCLFVQLESPRVRRMLNAALRQAWPDHPHRQLPAKPMSRCQFRHFRQKHLVDNDEEHQHLFSANERQAVKAAVHMGMLRPRDGSLAHPSSSRIAYGDDSYIRSRIKKPKTKGDPKRRRDPDARPYSGNNRAYAGSHGHHITLVGIRNSHRQERIPLHLSVRPAHKKEADRFVETVENLRDEHPEVRQGLLGVAYDMAIKSRAIDDLYDLGLLPIGKVSLTNSRKPASVVLHDETFHCTNGTTHVMDIRVLNTVPCVSFIDGNGDLNYQPLARLDTYRRPNADGTWRWYGEFQIPDHSWMGALAGATTTFRLDSIHEERYGRARRRTLALRGIPESDPYYKEAFGVREDAESTFSSMKVPMLHRRARSITARRVNLDLLAFQTKETITALIAHHERTGADVSQWFGQHSPLARDGPLLLAA